MPIAAIRSRFAPFTASPAVSAPSATPLGAAAPDESACVTCGRPAGTPFCPHCGERRAADHAYTLRAIVAEVWDHLTPADGKSLRSLWTLVRRPGALTTAYMRGMRQPFLSPLRLFLLVNLGYFAFAGVSGQHVLSTQLSAHIQYGFYAPNAAAMVKRRVAARGITAAEYERRFDANVETQARSLVVIMVPMYAALVAAVQIRRRRPALHHLAFGFHLVATLLVILVVGGFLLSYPLEIAIRRGALRVSNETVDFLVSSPLLLLFWAWLTFGMREAYGDGRWGAAAKAAVLAGLLVLVLAAYRAVLFFTAFWTT